MKTVAAAQWQKVAESCMKTVAAAQRDRASYPSCLPNCFRVPARCSGTSKVCTAPAVEAIAGLGRSVGIEITGRGSASCRVQYECCCSTDLHMGTTGQCMGTTDQYTGTIGQCMGTTGQCMRTTGQCTGTTGQCTGTTGVGALQTCLRAAIAARKRIARTR